MTAGARKDDQPEGFVRLVATAPLRAEPERVVRLLEADACPWPGGELTGPVVGGMRPYALDLRLPVGGGRFLTFSKAALLDLGTPRRTGDGWQAEISWRAATAAPLFPVFSGTLAVTPHELRIEGLYAPPGGAVGLVADRMLFHVAANGTARWLLDELDQAAREATG